MRILIAEDDAISRRQLQASVEKMGHEVVATGDGEEAWAALQLEDTPRLAILDWMMPGSDGVDICRRLRKQDRPYIWLILLTAKGQTSDLVAGLESGADDYITKPFHTQELRSRISVGQRILALQGQLATKVDELETALQQVTQLQGLLPICMHCKRIRDDHDAWHGVENYIEQHTEAAFTHSVCGECLKLHYPKIEPAIAKRLAQRREPSRS